MKTIVSIVAAVAVSLSLMGCNISNNSLTSSNVDPVISIETTAEPTASTVSVEDDSEETIASVPFESVYSVSGDSNRSSSNSSGSSNSSDWGTCSKCHKKKATHGVYCDDCYKDEIMELQSKGVSQTELNMWANGYSEYDDDYAYWPN